TYGLLEKDYILDLGIHRQEVDDKKHESFYYRSTIADQGDLSTYYGYETFDASGYKIVAPTISDKKESYSEINDQLLKKGIGYIFRDFPHTQDFTTSPVNIISKGKILPKFKLQPGVNPTFFLEKNGSLTHAVINGFLIDLSKPIENQNFGNALIYR
ncbi:MAG: peptidase M14, partial [Flavobacteriaceae bacterium]